MSPLPRRLTPTEIRTQHKVLSPTLVKVLFDREFNDYFEQEREFARAKGQALDVFFWPNGLTLFWHRRNADEPIDYEDMFDYVELMQRQQAFHERSVATAKNTRGQV